MKWHGWAGLILLLVSEYCLFRRIEPFYSWFYSFAWWSYILLADNLLLRLKGRSILFGRRGELLAMLPLSVFIWLIFECYNLVLHNWAYQGVPAAIWIRWPGYAVAFATVLPGVFITADILDVLIFGRGAKDAASECAAHSAPVFAYPRSMFIAIGALLSAAPLVFPRIFFPAIWLGPIFLLDPLLNKSGMQSLWTEASACGRRKLWSLLAGGLVCGVMWEFWNYWAASRWVYSIPYFNWWKVFEMPLLGFLGFPPFALECWILYHLLYRFQQRRQSMPARAAFWAAVAVFCLSMFYAIDRHTVLSFM